MKNSFIRKIVTHRFVKLTLTDMTNKSNADFSFIDVYLKGVLNYLSGNKVK